MQNSVPSYADLQITFWQMCDAVCIEDPCNGAPLLVWQQITIYLQRGEVKKSSNL